MNRSRGRQIMEGLNEDREREREREELKNKLEIEKNERANQDSHKVVEVTIKKY